MCNNTITNDPTTPQVCRYTTFEMSSVLKATIVNKTTSVTTHFKEINNKEQRVYCLSILFKVTVTSCRSSAGILYECLQQDGAPSHTDVPAAWERHVCRASHVAPKQPGFESSRLRCLGCPSTDGLSTSTIHDNHPDEAGNRHWMGQTVGAFHRLVSGVAALSGSSRSKANKMNIWCKKNSGCELL